MLPALPTQPTQPPTLSYCPSRMDSQLIIILDCHNHVPVARTTAKSDILFVEKDTLPRLRLFRASCQGILTSMTEKNPFSDASRPNVPWCCPNSLPWIRFTGSDFEPRAHETSLPLIFYVSYDRQTARGSVTLLLDVHVRKLVVIRMATHTVHSLIIQGG